MCLTMPAYSMTRRSRRRGSPVRWYSRWSASASASGVRRRLELLLRDSDCRVIGTADDAATGASVIGRRRPDVAVVDINLPDGSGIDLCRSVLANDPDLGVLLYTGIEDRETLGEALDCGA